MQNSFDYTKLVNLLKGSLKDVIEEVLEEKLSQLPSKEEFYSSQDKLITELKAMREETSLIAGQASRHANDLEQLKIIHPGFQHS